MICICGNHFTKTRYNKKYCSDRCGNISRKRKFRKANLQKIRLEAKKYNRSIKHKSSKKNWIANNRDIVRSQKIINRKYKIYRRTEREKYESLRKFFITWYEHKDYYRHQKGIKKSRLN